MYYGVVVSLVLECIIGMNETINVRNYHSILIVGYWASLQFIIVLNKNFWNFFFFDSIPFVFTEKYQKQAY